MNPNNQQPINQAPETTPPQLTPPPSPQPPQPTVAAPIQQPSHTVMQGKDPGKTLGIVSLVLAFIGLALVGLILAMIAKMKSSKAGFKNTLASVSIILNSVFLVLGLLFILFAYQNWRATQALANDNLVFAELRELNKGLVQYISQKSTKPSSLTEVVSYANLKSSVLTDRDGKAYTLSWEPAGCATLTTCTGYKLSGDSARHKGEKVSISYNAKTGKASYENNPLSSSTE